MNTPVTKDVKLFILMLATTGDHFSDCLLIVIRTPIKYVNRHQNNKKYIMIHFLIVILEKQIITLGNLTFLSVRYKSMCL